MRGEPSGSYSQLDDCDWPAQELCLSLELQDSIPLDAVVTAAVVVSVTMVTRRADLTGPSFGHILGVMVGVVKVAMVTVVMVMVMVVW